jgi:hypothetical protein
MVAGQAQKEYFVNEAHARADMLLHLAIIGESNDPPASPQEGECWLVGSSPSGDWSGQAGAIAGRQSGNWLFVTPRNGMAVLDQSAGQVIRYVDGWMAADPVAEPSGGAVVDDEARAAISGLVSALVAGGILPSV